MANEHDPEVPDYSVEILTPPPHLILDGTRIGLGDPIEVMTNADGAARAVVVTVVQPGHPAYDVALAAVRSGRWGTRARFRYPGPATLQASVFGAFGTVPLVSSDPIVVTVADTGPVAVAIDAPMNGAELSAAPGNASVAITVTATSAVLDRIEATDGAASIALRRGPSLPEATAWTETLPIPDAAPAPHTLVVRAFDYFGRATTAQVGYRAVDTTRPAVEILTPAATATGDAVFVTATLPYTLTVRGTAADSQSGLAQLEYSIDGTYRPIPMAASWSVDVVLRDYGYYTLRVRARDQSGNVSEPIVRQLSLATAYTPRTLAELISPRSYLQALLKFVRGHVTDASQSPIGTPALHAAFYQPFAELAQPTSDLGNQVLGALHVPVATALAHLQAPAARSPVRGEWGFDDPAATRLEDAGAHGNHGTLGPGARWGTGPTAGALDLTATGGASIPHTDSLALGRDDRDFSVSFWLYLRAGATGQWRTILFKGQQSAQSSRVPGVWMKPGTNQLHFRISTTASWDEGNESNATVSLHRWTQVTYVKSGRSLSLYLDGVLDAVATIAGATTGNTDPIHIGQNPYGPGFDGALDDLRIFDFALPRATIERLATDRNLPSPRTSVAAANQAYRQAAYEAALDGIGTSFTELRLLATASAEQRRALAERLGIAPERLPDLVPPPGGLVDTWLERMVGLPDVSRDPLGPSPPRPQLLTWQEDALRARWAAEATAPGTPPQPFVDPDLIDAHDLASADREHPLALALARRRRWLADQRAAILAAGRGSGGTLDRAITSVLGAVDLDDLARRDAAGEPIGDALAALRLPLPAFRRLLALRTLAAAASLTDLEWGDAADILTAVRRRQQAALWVGEEAALPLWPAGFRIAPTAPVLIEWRATIADRVTWQVRVTERQARWRQLAAGLTAAATAAEARALPVLRDGILVGRFGPEVSPAIADRLAERLLVDLAAGGAGRSTRIDHAVTAVQALVNGLRTGRFDGDHPATTWSIPELAQVPAAFDTEWSWMGTYDAWAAATSIFLHPERGLLPELRPNPSLAFTQLAADLRLNRRLTADGDAYFDALTGDEASYFGPMLVALTLRQAGSHAAALSWFRRVYDPSKPPAERAIAPLLSAERNTAPTAQQGDHWTRTSLDPHANAASGAWGNPYTRFTVASIAQCLLDYADSEFATGTVDASANALGLYLSVKELLASPELAAVPPTSPNQIIIPNPWLDTLAAHADTAVRKLRSGLGFAGLPVPQRRGAADDPPAAVGHSPTPYRFKVLVERARQLAGRAEQLEAQYLATLEKLDTEQGKLTEMTGVLQVATATSDLQRLRLEEAVDSTEVVRRQQARASLVANRYSFWIATGLTRFELEQLDAMQDAIEMRQLINVIDTASTLNTTNAPLLQVQNWLSLEWIPTAIATNLITARGVAQGFLTDAEYRSQLAGFYAAMERTRAEWGLRRDEARQDERIAAQQVVVALDHEGIARQEVVIADLQAAQAKRMIEFLINKFTSAELYGWLSGIVADAFAHVLRLATSTARLAEEQLAFERQQPLAGVLRADYWKLGSGPDRRGIGGSARLARDLALLDQAAFESERRLLNLSQSFSLARLAPFELQAFKRTGVLPFATPMLAFDEGFPGHYLRRIKRVRVSVAALVPPSVGIRATLTASGISRVVAGPPDFGTVTLRHDAPSVALTSPLGATGVFDLDEQSELLLPFEGMGVDTSWVFELPRAANAFDYDTIADVAVTIEYTALASDELRTRVIGRLPAARAGDRAWSVRRDLPDVWYDLNNPADPAAPRRITLPITPRSFPPQLERVSIAQVAIAVRSADGEAPLAAVVTPTFVGDTGQALGGAGVPIAHELASTRGNAAAAWSDLLGAATTSGTWTFTLGNDPTAPENRLFDRIAAGELDDILVVMSYAGQRPAW